MQNLDKTALALAGVIILGGVVWSLMGADPGAQLQEKINEYSAFLREVGQPVLPESGLLWILRIGLLAAVGLHVLSATELTNLSLFDITKYVTRRIPGGVFAGVATGAALRVASR